MQQGFNTIEAVADKMYKTGIKMLQINNKQEEHLNYKFLYR